MQYTFIYTVNGEQREETAEKFLKNSKLQFIAARPE